MRRHAWVGFLIAATLFGVGGVLRIVWGEMAQGVFGLCVAFMWVMFGLRVRKKTANPV